MVRWNCIQGKLADSQMVHPQYIHYATRLFAVLDTAVLPRFIVTEDFMDKSLLQKILPSLYNKKSFSGSDQKSIQPSILFSYTAANSDALEGTDSVLQRPRMGTDSVLQGCLLVLLP